MSSRRPIALVSLLLVSIVALGACGGSKGLVFGGNPNTTNRPSSGGNPTGTPGGNPTGTPGGGGDLVGGGAGCSVSITGDATYSWTSPQSSASVLVSYWYTDAERTQLSMAAGEESFLMNCESDTASLSFYTTTATTAAQFPKAAGQMTIGSGGLLGSSDPGKVTLLFAPKDKSLWEVPEDGTFTIKTLSGSRFSGSFQAKLERLGEDLTTVTAKATLTGTFDFTCTLGFACS